MICRVWNARPMSLPTSSAAWARTPWNCAKRRNRARGTYNVVAVFKGTGRARVLMLTHYDTVFPAGEAARRPFRREGDMAYGPGVADMQSSIALLIAAVEILHNKLGQRNYDTLTIHCNADEETGSYGSRALIRELGRSHHVSYNMEQSGREGELITISGRGIAKGTLAVTGIASHAGGGPEKGPQRRLRTGSSASSAPGICPPPETDGSSLDPWAVSDTSSTSFRIMLRPSPISG